MARNSGMIIAGADCEGCMYYEENTDNHNKITCKARNKQYFYGQCVPCDDREDDKR